MEGHGRIVFVALVTCYLLGRILGGATTALETVVYGATAAVGLESLMVSWAAVWRAGEQA